MTPEIILPFAGGFLRALKASDVHAGYVSGLNDPDVNRYLQVRYTVQTFESVVDFVIRNETSDDSVLWGIWQQGASRHCGTVRLHGVDHRQGRAHIGVCVFERSAWGNRVGSGAISAVTLWTADVLNIRHVEAGIYADNLASQKAFLAAGYVWVGDLPGEFIFEGKPTTVKVFATPAERKS